MRHRQNTAARRRYRDMNSLFMELQNLLYPNSNANDQFIQTKRRILIDTIGFIKQLLQQIENFKRYCEGFYDLDMIIF